MIDLIQKMNQIYGDRWFSYQPPGARPVSVIENTAPFNSDSPLEEILFFCEVEVQDSEVLVVDRYSVTLWTAGPSPLEGGQQYPYQLPETYFQGRMRWRPVADQKQIGIISSLLNGLTYNWAFPPYVPQRHEGYSLLKEYTDPRLLVFPGQTFAISIGSWHRFAGFIYPPFQTNLLCEMSGYLLTVPNLTKRDPRSPSIKEPSLAEKIPAFKPVELKRRKK